MTLVPSPRRLGRVEVPRVPRFDAKPQNASRPLDLDLCAWVAQVQGDSLATASIAVAPAVNGGVTVTGVQVSGSRVLFTASGGIEGTDFALTFTATTSFGRTDQFTARLFIPYAAETRR